MLTVVFRTDASYDIGSGHVMRCLTLASLLTDKGVECHFICRELAGNLIQYIKDIGFDVHTLSLSSDPVDLSMTGNTELEHAAWLGVTWQDDVHQSIDVIQKLTPDWVIVDHYALDDRWESCIRNSCSKIGVIDDLHDRVHNCDLLIDQTLGLTADVYSGLVPESCTLLVGAEYAMLRAEFGKLRKASLDRRDQSPSVKTILVNMGGVDKDNVTGRVLEGIELSSLPDNCEITVVLGSASPHVANVTAQALQSRRRTTILVNVSNMAELMSMADLAIGASGSTTWERCCLGLPSIMVVLAENQRYIAKQLSEKNIAEVVFNIEADFEQKIAEQISLFTSEKLSFFSHMSRQVTEGSGGDMVASYIYSQG